MLKDLNIGLKQRFNIKCGIDATTFAVVLALFVTYAVNHGGSPSETLIYIIAILAV